MNFSVKALNNKSSSKIQDIFDIEPQKALIPPHGHVFASVTFSPKEIRTFECIFEANVESSVKSKPLRNSFKLISHFARDRNFKIHAPIFHWSIFNFFDSFSISGDGALPRINILYPTLNDVLGNGILNFVRMPVGQTQTLPFSLVNVGTLAAQIHIDLEDRENFRLIPCNDKGNKILIQSDMSHTHGSTMTHTAQVTLEPTAEAHMMVVFKSNQVGTFNSHISITVLDNEVGFKKAPF